VRPWLLNSGIQIEAWVSQVGAIALHADYQPTEADLAFREQHPTRCPEPNAAAEMEALILEVRDAGDTIGGVVSARISGLPPGLGEPLHDKLHARLGHAMLTINAVKGFEYGDGFAGSQLRGSQANDVFVPGDGRPRTLTNHSGGIQGGISNGEEIPFRVAFKPVATLLQEQVSVNRAGEAITLAARGRHDPCVLPRAVPIVEAMALLVVADFLLIAQGNRN
jgi:chorismate synthase